MKAILATRYGPPELLQLREVARPRPGDREVLVRVLASSVNAADLDQVEGRFMVRLGGLGRPSCLTPGSDVAGRVEEAGRAVVEFRPGDEVFGDLTEWGFGAFAEFVCVPAEALVAKPTVVSFQEAAATPTAGSVALLNLCRGRPIEPGDKVLINGAGGGMGSFAVQIARSFGAEVTGVDAGGKLDLVRSIGADHVIDYTRNDFTRSGERYDLILDVAAHHSIFACRRALAPGGLYRFVGGGTGAALQAVFLGPLFSRKGGRSLGVLMAYPKKPELIRLKELLEAGGVKPAIDQSYPLAEVGKALRRLADGRVRGKLAIIVG